MPPPAALPALQFKVILKITGLPFPYDKKAIGNTLTVLKRVTDVEWEFRTQQVGAKFGSGAPTARVVQGFWLVGIG